MVVSNQVQQVLLNLIINSMEAMPDGGEIYIKTARDILESEGMGISNHKSGIEIIIEDTGPGIQDRDRENIFEPFVSTKENGTGLGLAVSYGIITAHGGTLNIVEDGLRGACFRITLPEGDAV
jgi:signal transduction histidine kinase